MEAQGVGTGNGAGSKSTQFKPGWKGGPGRPRGSSAGKGDAPATPLGDMRHVYTNPPSKDRTPNQRRCRQFLEEDYKAFITIYLKLEEADRAEVAAAATPATAKETADGEREVSVEELAEQLLAEWEQEERRRNELQ